MKVMLTSDVPILGTVGKIKEVAAGFARNYLLPKRLAIEINKKNVKIVNNHIQQLQNHENKLINVAKKLAIKLEQLKLCTQLKIGDNNKTFGAITSTKIANLLHESGFKIDKHKIILYKDIKEIGQYTIDIKLHPQVIAKLSLLVTNK
jgi:large subunit ribosomal protein L9